MSVVGSYAIGKLYQETANHPTLLKATMLGIAIVIAAGISLVVAMT